jgi:hypothetical protein
MATLAMLLIGDEPFHGRVPQNPLGLEVLHPHPQLRPKPLSRTLPQPRMGGLATANAAIRSLQAALSA